jgi:hypothetical protein
MLDQLVHLYQLAVAYEAGIPTPCGWGISKKIQNRLDTHMKSYNEWVISQPPKFIMKESNGICPFCSGRTVDEDNSRKGGMQCDDCKKKWSNFCEPPEGEKKQHGNY